MACCDCNLVHDLEFRIRKGRVQFRARRNNRGTGQLRRHVYAKLESLLPVSHRRFAPLLRVVYRLLLVGAP